ncbi:GRIP and coiled-coil domain-containing protein 1 [Pimephales promelas]|uniref:GRIP and coiled-coil domain-containing protein 1 n=1 Tax=Pimephales promelas TaxID=90988 RepID=UPI001955DEA4|nr:GRIP and coiled-coil domain-containing protein 1 [Pimephales promelas]XP_039524227.1 GRIP and coiled-coil domain-containing protein 1 [Pimephales promelas]XP_039524228.1 GRIP and coiled-coil domain-containing protein 1 [Pimephales promelas]KAG1953264.1 GRIP and coiled-coil domain-containing protein [Pimephales promelas]KAG1953265.1 GRIP and coiled-coil domain-containing protein [Pimephales promelas]
MDKFGMSFTGGPSKKELQETIELQKKQLVKYQTRFKDVVRAYQSLIKEKEALEASLKVLSISQEVDFSQRDDNLSFGDATEKAERSLPSYLGDDRCSVHSEDSLDTAASAETATSVTSNSTKGDQIEEDHSCAVDGATSGAVVHALPQQSEEASGSESGISTSSSGCTEPQPPAADTDRRVIQLKTQLSTLTSSLSTITQEKSRMEASFQADKRKIKQELEELQARMEEDQKQHQMEIHSLQELLAESKARVITQQHEREQEQGDHALMLRELQKLLQEERGLRQDAELKLEDSREALAEAMQAVDRGLDYESQLKEISQEREELRKSLKAAAAESSKPDPRVEELQQEIADLKAHFNQQLQQEIRKVAQADELLREQAQMEEGRVASLEERVSELSELLGACEKARQMDQQKAQRLRERILQLDTENKTLAMAAVNRTSISDLNIDDANLNVDALKDKLEKVKKLLLLAAQRSQDRSLDIERLLEGEKDQEISEGEKASALHYQQELRQLREEFERYKMRAQGVLKNKTTKDGNQSKDLEEARDQLAELKEKYINLRILSDEAEAQHKRDLEERQQGLVALQQAHKQEVERLEAQHRENLLRLEEELHKQRDRTMALLSEKDLALERLRATAVMSFGSHQRHATNNSTAMEGGDLEEVDPKQEESDIVAQALKLAGPNEPTLLLYAEQLARKEVEVAALRKQKHRLEEDLHQLQGKLIAKGERHEEELAELQCQLDKHIRDQGRDGANLEYLKNVIYRFLTLHDTRGRQQTLTAILTILHFSPQEKQAVLKLQPHNWWKTGMR